MGKRSTFPRVPQDAYSTPAEAVAPLLPHLEPGSRFFEPCAGQGQLIEHLVNAGHICVGRCDLPTDARTWRDLSIESGMHLHNQPAVELAGAARHHRQSLQSSAGVVVTRQRLGPHAAVDSHLPRLQKIVSVGRLKWIEDSPHTSKDNAAWMLFTLPRPDECAVTHFIGRTDSMRRAA